MNTSAPRSALLAVAALTVPVVLAGCSQDSSSDAASSSAAATSTTSSASSSTTSSATTSSESSTASSSAATSSTPSSSTASSSTSSSASSTSSATSSAPRSSTATSTSQGPLNIALVNDCRSALGQIGAATTKWNLAARGKSESAIDDAADTMGSTAVRLRTLARDSKDTGFANRTRDVASAMANIKNKRDDKESVDSSTYNSRAKTLRTYCVNQITGSND